MKSQVIDGVTVIEMDALLESLLGRSWYMEKYEDEKKAWDSWQVQNEAALYIKPRATFNVQDAVQKAERNGKSIVVVDEIR